MHFREWERDKGRIAKRVPGDVGSGLVFTVSRLCGSLSLEACFQSDASQVPRS